MYRIICSKLLVLIRLAVIVSLVGYTMPNVYASMHGAGFAEIEAASSNDHHSDSHDHGASLERADAGHHAPDEDGGKDPGKQVKKNCCQDFCFSVALPSPCQALGPLMVSSALRAFDDSRVPGTRPSFHRPPNI